MLGIKDLTLRSLAPISTLGIKDLTFRSLAPMSILGILDLIFWILAPMSMLGILDLIPLILAPISMLGILDLSWFILDPMSIFGILPLSLPRILLKSGNLIPPSFAKSPANFPPPCPPDLLGAGAGEGEGLGAPLAKATKANAIRHNRAILAMIILYLLRIILNILWYISNVFLAI